MNQLEQFLSNLDISDKYTINDINISKDVAYRGLFSKILNKEEHNYCKCQVRPLASAVLGVNNTDIPIPDNVEFYNAWTDVDAQEAYLKKKPISYFILGKPGVGTYTLGESLSKKLNCIHVCPKPVLIDEIDQKSSTGCCIDFNMRHNKVCQINTLLSMMKKKLESAAIKHRGFVLSGLPLLSSDTRLELFFDSLFGEESIEVVENVIYDILCNMKKKKGKVPKGSPNSSNTSGLGAGEEEEAEEEQDVEAEAEEIEERVELPKFILDTCCDIIAHKKAFYTTKRAVILQQIQDIFSYKPDIIIHITCSNSDIIAKRNRKYFNYVHSSYSVYPFLSQPELELTWPPKYTMSEYSKPFDSHSFNPKYNCKHPLNFKWNAKGQICNYKQHVQNFIDEKIKNFDPKFLIQLDGRITNHQMMFIIMERISLLPIKAVLFPEPLYLDEPPEDIDEFWKTVEELNVVRIGNVNFNRYSSAWYNRCPVELKQRRSVQGNPRYAVSFFKHVYLLSSLNAMVTFCRNPRPFLKLKYLEPTCRVIVMGSSLSGKTMISKCLSWLFDVCNVISYNNFLLIERQKKYDTYSINIFKEIIPVIEDARFTMWQNTELQRVSDLNMWFNINHNALISYVHLNKEIIKKKDTEIEPREYEALLKKLNSMKSNLTYFPFIEDMKLCQSNLQGQNLVRYAPVELKEETEKPMAPVLGDADVIEAIATYIKTNDLQKEIEPTPEEIMKEMIKVLNDMDDDNLSIESSYSKFIIDGFPTEIEYWELLSEAKLTPDYTIVLIENREIDEELIEHYVSIRKGTKNYEERYLSSNDALVKLKLLSGCPINSNFLTVKTIADEIVNNSAKEDTEHDINIAELSATYTENFEKLKENWEAVKLKIDEQSKSYIEVELEGKSDIDVVDEVLLKLRKGYCNLCSVDEDKDFPDQDNENESEQNLLTFNDDRQFPETNVYCPVAFYDYNVLWEGKSEICSKYDNKLYLFSKEECIEMFQKNFTNYQSLSEPFKELPSVRICIVGTIGSGKTSISRRLAKELGLLYVDFNEYINNFILPKHYKKIGWKYENSFTDINNEEENVELQIDEENENYLSDLISNETELRRVISNYFENGVALPSLLTHKIIKNLWFEEPFKTTGIVLDGFPKLPNDVEDMLTCYCIPDIVIELENNTDKALERISPNMFKKWKSQLRDAKYKAQQNFDAERKIWLDNITEKAVIRLIVDEIIDSACVSNELMPKLSALSTIIDAHPSGSSNVDPNLFNIYNELIQEFPEPIDQSEWEKPDDVLETINSRIESIYEVFDENIQGFKDILVEQKVKVVTVNGVKSMDKVFRNCLAKLVNLRKRNESFLEQTLIINNDLAEMLINEGFFFLSKFYRVCPVHIYENPLALFNPYSISKRKGKVYPIVHRAYIYFISSEDNVIKFRTNPLKYIKCSKIEYYIEFPLRISIIGPPKSGKSTLAAKLAKRFGLLCFSKGMALRHVLENMRWTDLGSKIISTLQSGNCVNTECIIKSIKAAIFDHRVMTHGYVFDGFPETTFEASELVREGLYPLIVLDLKTDLPNILERSPKEIYLNILKVKPTYCNPLIEFRFHQWDKTCSNVRQWIVDDIQNIYELCGNSSKWKCLRSAHQLIDMISPKYHNYLSDYKSKIVTADVMCITNEYFKTKMSNFKNFCPMCFVQNIFKNSECPVNKKGVVHYKDHFYWICDGHMQDIQKLPSIVLPVRKIELPEIAAVVKTINASLVYENGVCIVSYAENLPAQKIIKGSNTYAALYKGHYYLFCRLKCLNKFIARPHMYYDIHIFKETSGFPTLSLNKLPSLGYLEQAVGNIITDACCAVNVFRPKYLGLDIRVSAAIYIALYLKTHNKRIGTPELTLYKKSFTKFEARCKLSIDVGLCLRSVDNPFVEYPNCCGPYASSLEIDSGTVDKPSTLSISDSPAQ